MNDKNFFSMHEPAFFMFHERPDEPKFSCWKNFYRSNLYNHLKSLEKLFSLVAPFHKCCLQIVRIVNHRTDRMDWIGEVKSLSGRYQLPLRPPVQRGLTLWGKTYAVCWTFRLDSAPTNWREQTHVTFNGKSNASGGLRHYLPYPSPWCLPFVWVWASPLRRYTPPCRLVALSKA